MTCNSQWPEIVNNLPPTQTAEDRPDLVVRVFNAKFHRFLDDITKKHVLGKPVAWSWVIEFQKRGLPHVHCLFIMDPASQPTTLLLHLARIIMPIIIVLRMVESLLLRAFHLIIDGLFPTAQGYHYVQIAI